MFSKENLKHYLIILLASIAAIASHGYQFAVSDQEIFIPYILKWKEPYLFPNDLLFSQPSASASLFYPIFGFLARFADLQSIFFLGYLLFQFFFFLAIYRLSYVIVKDQKLAYLALLPFFLPKFIGGTATFTFDTFFGYRSVGVVFMVLHLSYLLEKKFQKAAISALLSAVFHPLSIIPIILLFPLIFIKENFKIQKKPIVLILSILLLVILLLSQFLPKDNSWLSIIKFRDDYLFVSAWSIRAWLAVALYTSLLFILLRSMKPQMENSVLLIVIISFSFFVSNYLILEIIKTPFIAKFQLVRAISPIAYISLAISPLLLTYRKPILKILGFFSFIFLCLNFFNIYLVVFLIFGLIFFLGKNQLSINLSPRFILMLAAFIFIIFTIKNFSDSKTVIQFPKAKDEWIDLQLLAKNNTPNDALFLVPPKQTGFRTFSNRSVVGDIKDGAVVIYDRAYALEWFEVINQLESYQHFNERDFQKLRQIYPFDYIVTKKEQSLDLSVFYKNKSFTIYKIYK